MVVKSTTDEDASTTVRRLKEEEKVDEIARMLGGVKKTDQSLAHAEAMLSEVKLSDGKEPEAKSPKVKASKANG